MPAAEGMTGRINLEQLAKFVGTTVTIYTTSGGESGVGITGVLECVDPCTVKLVTCTGPAPCCALGSACTGGRIDGGFAGSGPSYGNATCGLGGFYIDMCGYHGGCITNGITNVGSVTVIPVDRIAAYVHNAI